MSITSISRTTFSVKSDDLPEPLSWSNLNETHPSLSQIPARSSHTCTALKNQLYLFGGYGGVEPKFYDVLSDFYSIDLTNLTVSCESPLDRAVKRVGHKMVNIKGNLYAFGGWNGKKYLNHGFMFDAESSHLVLEKYKGRTTPDARRDHTLTMVSSRRLLLFGGWNCLEQFNDTWLIDKTTWSWRRVETMGDVPCPRRGHTATRIGKFLYVFGGIYGFSKYLSDLFVLDLETMEWSAPLALGEGPSCRAWHTALRIGDTPQILFFGGTAGRINFYNDLHVLDTSSLTWFRLPTKNAPPPRCSHDACMVGSKLYVFGGLVPSNIDNKVLPQNDLWVMDTGLEVIENPNENNNDDDDDDEDDNEIGGTAFDAQTNAPDVVPDNLEGWLSLVEDEGWKRRYVTTQSECSRLLVHELREKGRVELSDGIVKLWSEKKLPFHQGGEWDDVNINTLTLEHVFAETKRAMNFLEWCKSKYSEENVLFYLAVEKYRKMEDVDIEERISNANAIYEEYMKPGAPHEIQVPPMVRNQVSADLGAQEVTSGTFDHAQKRVFNLIAVQLFPEYRSTLSATLSAKPAGFSMKTALTEQDKTIMSCSHCQNKFAFPRKIRNFCRFCSEIFCGGCVSNQAKLPHKYGVGEYVRVCDMCNGVLMRREHAFSFVSKNRSRPLNLVADSANLLELWTSTMNKAIEISKIEPDKRTADMTLHLEGWLKKEDPTTKIFRRRYFILHNDVLWYYQHILLRPVDMGGHMSIQRTHVKEATLQEEHEYDRYPPLRTCCKGGFEIGSDFSFRFNIETKSEGTLRFAAQTEQGRIQWIDVAQRLIDEQAKFSENANQLDVVPMVSQTVPRRTFKDTAPTGEVTFVITEGMNATLLWDNIKEQMQSVVHNNQGIVQRTLSRYGGYILKANQNTIKFEFAFATAVKALLFCIEVQLALLQYDWPALECSQKVVANETDDDGNEIILFNGVRLQMGLHTGYPQCQSNPLTGRIAYSGTVLKVARSICEFADGGQIVCTHEVYARILGEQAKVAERVESRKAEHARVSLSQNTAKAETNRTKENSTTMTTTPLVVEEDEALDDDDVKSDEDVSDDVKDDETIMGVTTVNLGTHEIQSENIQIYQLTPGIKCLKLREFKARPTSASTS